MVGLGWVGGGVGQCSLANGIGMLPQISSFGLHFVLNADEIAIFFSIFFNRPGNSTSHIFRSLL